MNQPRRMSFAIARSARFESHRADDPSDPVRYNGPRRRIADAIDQAFRVALVRGDIATAEELVAVLRGMEERRNVTSRVERRHSSALLERAQRDLNAKKAARFRRF